MDPPIGRGSPKGRDQRKRVQNRVKRSARELSSVVKLRGKVGAERSFEATGT